MKKSITILITALLMVSLLWGCGQQDPYIPTGNGLGEQGATQPTLTPGGAEQKLSLVYHPDKTMNPYSCADYTNRALFSLIYQGLFTVDKDYQVKAMLCSRLGVGGSENLYFLFGKCQIFRRNRCDSGRCCGQLGGSSQRDCVQWPADQCAAHLRHRGWGREDRPDYTL